MIPALLAGLLTSASADDGRTRLVLAIGVNEGLPNQDRLRHAVSDARRFADVLVQLGDVEAADVRLVEDATLASIMRAFGETARDAALARQRGETVELFLYYSGHSDDQGLTPAGERLDWPQLDALTRSIPAELRVSILDSCASGAFLQDKGGEHVPPLLRPAGSTVEGQAVLTSASADESAQESARLGGSFFTWHLVAGLRGAADVDADRRVTLSEAWSYAYEQTVAATELSWAGTQHPYHRTELRGQGDVVLTELRERTSQIVLDVRLDGEVSIRDERGDLVVEVAKPYGRDVAVAVPPGAYTLRLRQGTGAYKGRVVASADAPTRVSADQLEAVVVERTALRGPAPDTAERHHPVSVHLAPRLGSYGLRGRVATDYFSFNVLGAMHEGLGGLELGSGSWTRGDLDGVAINGAFTHTNGFVHGAQLSALWTHARQLEGAQIAGFTHVNTDVEGFQGGVVARAGGHLWGAQLAGLAIVDGASPEGSAGLQVGGLYARVAGHFQGAQFGAVTDADELDGLQVGGVNVTRRLRGVQLGGINVVTRDSAHGETIGVLNLVRDGYHAVEVGTDALSPVSLRVKAGSRHLYTVYRIGWDPTAHDGAGLTLGLGFGGHARYRRFAFDLDLAALLDERSAADTFTLAPSALLFDLSLTPAIQLTDHLAVFAGGGPVVGLSLTTSPALDPLDGDLFVPLTPGTGGTIATGGSWHGGVRVQF
jgi:hypothetical protein